MPAMAIVGVGASPRNSHAQPTPNRGMRYVQVIARAAPTRAMSRNNNAYAIPVHRTPSAAAASHDFNGTSAVGQLKNASGASISAEHNCVPATAAAGGMTESQRLVRFAAKP